MLISDRSLRLMPQEITSHRELGIDLLGVKSPDDYANALQPWAETLAEERPDLLEKFVEQLAKAKGITLPPKLSLVP